MKVAQIDLNLLVVLETLVSEGSVTRAARRLGRGQPAVSHALGRLRALLDDPILVRTSRGMKPTPRALEVMPALRRALDDLQQVITRPAGFDARVAHRRFTVVTRDYVEALLLPAVMRRLLAEAPSVSVRVLPLEEPFPAEQLESGAVDLAIGYLPTLPSSLRQQTLLRDRFVCVMRRGHPAASRKLTVRELTRHAHLLVSPAGSTSGFTDTALAQHGLSRTIAAFIPDFVPAAVVLAETDLVAILSERIALRFAGAFDLVTVELPMAMRDFRVDQIWSSHVDSDPAHRWFRSVVAAAAESCTARARGSRR